MVARVEGAPIIYYLHSHSPQEITDYIQSLYRRQNKICGDVPWAIDDLKIFHLASFHHYYLGFMRATIDASLYGFISRFFDAARF